jgi:hypothetical protein
MPTDGITQPRGLRQIKVSRQSGKGGQACNTILILVLEWKNALCHNCFTSLVIVVCSHKHSISPALLGSTRFFIF